MILRQDDSINGWEAGMWNGWKLLGRMMIDEVTIQNKVIFRSIVAMANIVYAMHRNF